MIRQYCKWVCLGILSMAALMVAPVFAQLPTATILGVAKDSSGAVLPNATITITNVDTELKRRRHDRPTTAPIECRNFPWATTKSGANMPDSRPKPSVASPSQVTDQDVINFTFEVGSSQQEVTVSAEVSVVNTQDATLGGLVTETAIKDLPLNGRNYVDLTLLQPGVTKDKNIGNSATGGGGGFGTTFSVNGAPGPFEQFHARRGRPAEPVCSQPQFRGRHHTGRGRNQGI